MRLTLYYLLICYFSDNCENLPTANAVSYDQSNIDREMIDAAKINNTALFKCLLQNGANVNAVDSDGISALTYAVAVGNTGIFFLEHIIFYSDTLRSQIEV